MEDLITLGVAVQTKGGVQAAQDLGAFKNAAKGAAGAADELENKVNALGAAQSKSAAPTKAMTSAVGGLGSAFKNNSGAIQNASFQLQDVIVQMEMGVPITRTLGQQLPQLLGGFGPLGAVLGLAAGALLTFAPLLFSTSAGTSDLKTATDDLTDAMGAFGAATKAANQDFTDLRNTYGVNSDAAQHFLEIQREIAELHAKQAFGQAASAVAGAGLGELAGYSAAQLEELTTRYAVYNEGIASAALEIANLQGLSRDLTDAEQTRLDQLYEQSGVYEDARTALLDYTIGVAELEKALGAAEGTGSELAAAFARLSEAKTFEEQSTAAQQLADLLYESTDGLRSATEEGDALFGKLVKAVEEAFKLDQLSYGKGGLDAAAVSASALADEINRAASNAISLAEQSLTARTEAEIRLQFRGDTVGQAGALAAARFPKPANLPDAPAAFIERQRAEYIANAVAAAEAQKALADLNAELKGGSKAASTAASDIKRYYDATRTDAEKYAAGLAEIGMLHASGAMNADLYARSAQQLAEQFDPLGQIISGLADTVENELNVAFASVIDGTASLGDALLSFASNVLAKVAQDLFAEQFAAPIAAGIKSFITSEDGNVFGPGGFVPFAKGGVVSGPTIFPFANGTGLMGEAGPEAIMPLSRGSDGKLGVVAQNTMAAPAIINNYGATDGVSLALLDAIKKLAQAASSVSNPTTQFKPELKLEQAVIPFKPEFKLEQSVIPFKPALAQENLDTTLNLNAERALNITAISPPGDVMARTPYDASAGADLPPRSKSMSQVSEAKSATAPKITINNYSGQEASASTDNMGNIIVEIGRAIAQDITGGGPTYRAIKSTFGISNRLQQRG